MEGERAHNRKNSCSICKNDEEKNEDGTTTPRRIYVGGLGGTVMAEDLRNTFSCLGKVDSVEILRTQGLSFAYMDFLPSSPKSLSKLFSTYNGCMWKGGRLRLENAKEHYLHRLRREWAEGAKFSNSAPSNAATANMGSPEKFNKVLNPEKMEVRLFFPKLKKVKALPYNGTGKHKYSFQRVDVPPLPIHFCDCEEHSDPSDTAKGKEFFDLETQGGGIDEKELDMMKSVMNKLFERESVLKDADRGTGLVEEGDNATKSGDDLLVDENETDQLTDEDNLITNMVAGGKNKTALSGSWGQETSLANEGAIVCELRNAKENTSSNVIKSQRRKIVASDKKRKTPLTEDAGGNGIFSVNHLERKGSAKKTHVLESAPAVELESGFQQTNSNISWSQKSAWRDLAGESGNNSFCVSHILQSSAPTREESKSDGVDEHQDHNLVKTINSEAQSGCVEEPKELAVTQSKELDAALNKSARGASWLRKSSWTQLVGQRNSSFSISQLLPGTTFEKQEQVEPKSMDAANSTVRKYSKLANSGSCGSSEDGSKASGVGNGDGLTTTDGSNMVALATTLDPVPIPPRENLQPVREKTGEITAQKKSHGAAGQPSARNFTNGETCSFLRTAASVKEWKNAKAALSGSFKKKNNDK